jgi:hypothetical protein
VDPPNDALMLDLEDSGLAGTAEPLQELGRRHPA